MAAKKLFDMANGELYICKLFTEIPGTTGARMEIGQMAEWLKATDCKSVLVRVRRFESFSAH